MRRGLPNGTVTFLFTDIEGSTSLLAELTRTLREALARTGGDPDGLCR